MNIEKDERIWEVIIVKPSTACDHLIFPANYHGCSFNGTNGDIPKCTMETCPLFGFKRIK